VSMPSFILIHATVWPQYTSVSDTGQTGQDGTDRQWSDPIGLGEPFYKRSPKTAIIILQVNKYYTVLLYSRVPVHHCSIIFRLSPASVDKSLRP